MAEALQTILVWFSTGFRSIAAQLGVSLLLLALLYGARVLLLRVLLRRTEVKAARVRWRKNTAYLTSFTLIVLLFPVWLPSIQNVLAVLGLFGAGVLIVLKEVILNAAGWFYILIRRPFEEGNRIEIDGLTGDVIDVRVLEFSMMEVRSRDHGGQSTGRVLHLPNSMLFTKPLANSSKEFMFNWNELNVELTLDSDWQRAAALLEEIAASCLEEINRNDQRIIYSEEEHAIRYRNLAPTVYVEVGHGQIVLSLRHLHEPRSSRQISNQLWRDILTRFRAEPGIRLTGEAAAG